MERYYSTKQAAAHIGVSTWTLHKRIKARMIGRKIGRDWMFTKMEVDLLAVPGVRGNPTLRKKVRSA